ncbi:hypothetical protein IEQ34_014597 [Dendrobium chrysotoxum]|uniref:Uncharacterized protein n=1 Tax=Dendrobium chrysotoxum TaxID=161865 RepID=A0AAV7G3M8_DENCH|nr:hypothetical protein IEQ34_014597 [Dendrobium chrysotoxum]
MILILFKFVLVLNDNGADVANFCGYLSVLEIDLTNEHRLNVPIKKWQGVVNSYLQTRWIAKNDKSKSPETSYASVRFRQCLPLCYARLPLCFAISLFADMNRASRPVQLYRPDEPLPIVGCKTSASLRLPSKSDFLRSDYCHFFLHMKNIAGFFKKKIVNLVEKLLRAASGFVRRRIWMRHVIWGPVHPGDVVRLDSPPNDSNAARNNLCRLLSSANAAALAPPGLF